MVKVTEAELLDYRGSKGINPDVSAYSGTPLTNENRSLDHLDPLEREWTLGQCVQTIFLALSRRTSQSKQRTRCALSPRSVRRTPMDKPAGRQDTGAKL